MSLEIRQLTEDEIEPAEAIAAYAFNSQDRHNLAPQIERAKRFYRPEWYLGAFEDGEMSAMMRILPFAMRINGRGLPFGTVGPVASSPLHRRKGHTGAMLRRSIELMREQGQWLSGLYTPHPMLYRRYGWEIAGERRIYTFKPKDFQPKVEPSQRGRFRMLKPADWQQLDRVYRVYARERNGPLQRGDVWWRNAVLGDAGTQPFDIVLWENDSGEPQGYMVYTQPNPNTPDGVHRVVAQELVSVSGDAYLNLLSYLARHDIHNEIVLRASPDDPLMNVIADAERVNVRQEYTALLRICDVEAALQARPPKDAETTAEVTLAIDDPVAPWNNGTWRVGVAEGKTWAERTQSEAEVSASATALAPIFNGYLAPSQAAGAGLVVARSEDALARADLVFGVKHRPFFTDGF